MPKAKQLTQPEKDQIDLLRRVNPDWSQSKIAKSLGRSQQVISSYLLSPETHGKGQRTGRPRVKTSKQDARAIVSLATKEKKSCPKIKNDL